MDWLLQLDGNILLWIQENIRKEFLDPAVMFLTSLGNAGWFWIALFVVFLFFPKYRKTGITGFMALAIGFLITNLWLKNSVARIRPYEVVKGLRLIGNAAVDFSFPSGHSTCSMAAAVVLWKECRGIFGKCALVLAVLICLSRLYIGIHYPTDVLAGMLIGIFSAFAALWVMNRKKEKTGISQ